VSNGRSAPTDEPHAITRARERFGLELTVVDLRAIAATCRGNPHQRTRKEGDTETYVLRYKGQAMQVVVNAAKSTVITLTPLNFRPAKGRRKILRRKGERCRD
jgi:hypothetical protein